MLLDEIERLKTLKNLNTPGEIASAVARVQEMLFDIEDRGPYIEKLVFDMGAVQFLEWRKLIMISLCYSNGAACITSTYHRIPTVILEGPKVNLDTIIEMYNFIVANVRRLVKEEWDYRGKRRFQERQFFTKTYQGYIGTIDARIRDFYEKLKNE